MNSKCNYRGLSLKYVEMKSKGSSGILGKKTIGISVSAGPNSVLKMVSLVNNEGLVHPKPVIKVKVTVGSYHAPIQEVVDLHYHQNSFVCLSD